MMALNEIRQQTRRLFLTNKEENLTIDGFPIFFKAAQPLENLSTGCVCVCEWTLDKVQGGWTWMKNEHLRSEVTFWNHSVRHLIVEKSKTRIQKLIMSHPLGTAGRGGKALTVPLPNLKSICLEVCTLAKKQGFFQYSVKQNYRKYIAKHNDFF